MQATSLFLGACALVSIAGAVGGNSINTVPIQKATIGSSLVPAPSFAADTVDAGYAPQALPDHYAMTTPEGRIDVAELSARGLYAQERFGWRDAALVQEPEPAFAPPPPEFDAAPVLSDTGPEMDPSLELATPAELPVTLAASSGPKVIDVAAALASR